MLTTQIFERKTSLFSLALSEVLLINLWTTDVGRFEGANYGLLKTVFDLNLQLFTKQRGGYGAIYVYLFRCACQLQQVLPQLQLKLT